MVPTTLKQTLQDWDYDAAADAYQRRLPLEHYMEATAQAKQRAITLASLGILESRRTDFHLFNELLVQYPIPRPLPGKKPIGFVVPDNMVVLYDGVIGERKSYNVAKESALPFWMLEYVSADTERKDYVQNRRIYERRMQVPYYLLFDPLVQELILFEHDGHKYVPVKANAQGRLEMPNLDLEMAVRDGWVRFWHRGELLPVPAEVDAFRAAERKAREDAEIEARQEARARRAADKRADTAEDEKHLLEEENRLLKDRLRQLGQTP